MRNVTETGSRVLLSITRAQVQDLCTPGRCTESLNLRPLTVWTEVLFAETINHPDRTLQSDLSSWTVGWELTAPVCHATPVHVKSLVRRRGMKAMQRLPKTLFIPFKVARLEKACLECFRGKVLY